MQFTTMPETLEPSRYRDLWPLVKATYDHYRELGFDREEAARLAARDMVPAAPERSYR